MNKKGFTLIEIIVSISLISIVIIFLFQIIITIKNLNDNEINKTNNQISVTIITREVEKDLNSFGLEDTPILNCDKENNNIIPSSAEKVNCVKLVYDSKNIKNNEGYLIYYKNNGKNFLAYKRGKNNIIESQTVREISIEPEKENNINILKEENNNIYSLKIIIPIKNDKYNYDLVINYVEPSIKSNKKVNINVTGGELTEVIGEGIYNVGSSVTIKYSYDKSKYFLDGVTCTNVSCDNNEVITFIMPDKNVDINISLKEKNISNYLNKIYENQSNSDLEMDDTDDHNLRYVGATPNNYISFNNEVWRIIGIFDVYNNDTKKNEKLVKIIRNESLGDYSWDSSESSINSGHGINEWSQADLMTELNTDYIDTTKTSGTTTWYDSTNNSKRYTYDYSKNIKSGYIDKIANVRWNLGGINTSKVSSNIFYTSERGNNHASGSSDGVTRNNYWDGRVGLVYPSDYGYASIDAGCRNNINSSNCKNNNWLFKGSFYWFLSPSLVDPAYSYRVLFDGTVDNAYVSSSQSIYPTVYLKSNVEITGGVGTNTNPFTIG